MSTANKPEVLRDVAVVGAGFCGLATALNLAKHGFSVTIFDSLGIGKGASGVAAGLLHKYVGARAKKNIDAEEGLKATLELLDIAASHIGKPVFKKLGFQRFAISESQVKDFQECAKLHSDVSWKPQEANSCTSLHPSIFIEDAFVVDTEKYLQGLWLACKGLNVKLEIKTIEQLSELNQFEHVVISMGASSKKLPELSSLSITPVKGQVLVLKKKENCPNISSPLSSQGYLLRQPDSSDFIAGATYERNFIDEEPDSEFAAKEILPKIDAFFPYFEKSDIIACKAGVRASTKDHLPIIKHLGNRRWVLTGMGSKGLLYHAFYAKELCRQITEG